MSTLVTILHVLVCLFLMLTVLLQSGKGGGMGAAFGGGGGQTVFGGTGAGNFLRKLTVACAAIFMLTSITLAYMASNSGADALKRYSVQQRRAAEVREQARQNALQGAELGEDDTTPPIEAAPGMAGEGSTESGEPDEAAGEAAGATTGTEAQPGAEATGTEPADNAAEGASGAAPGTPSTGAQPGTGAQGAAGQQPAGAAGGAAAPAAQPQGGAAAPPAPQGGGTAASPQ